MARRRLLSLLMLTSIGLSPLSSKAASTTGQVCVSVQRVFIHSSVAREFAERLAEGANTLNVGDPTLSETEVGPLIVPAEVARVHEWVTQAADGGAEVMSGGEALGETAYKPTVLFNPPADANVSKLEIFGPVVCDLSVRRHGRRHRNRQFPAVSILSGNAVHSPSLSIPFLAIVSSRSWRSSQAQSARGHERR